MADLSEILEKTLSSSEFSNVATSPFIADPQDQAAALGFLENGASVNFAEFTRQLSAVLRTSANEPVRQAAGLQLKNALVAKDVKLLGEKAQRWLAVDAALRAEIKGNVSSRLPFV